VEQDLGEPRGWRQEEVRDRMIGQPQPGRAQQHERPDAVRCGDREPGRDPAAERGPHHVRRLQPERVEHVEVVVDEVVDPLRIGESSDLPKPGLSISEVVRTDA